MLTVSVTVAGATSTTDTYGICGACAVGCADPAADNYDATATLDDGSCTYSGVVGMMLLHLTTIQQQLLMTVHVYSL